ncbi:hypothetical protein DCM90_06100 [Levilactobacillus bambusae]|uniref:NAD-dependent epimerase/dehydratase domain-containing protein n=1 Tax=Levilactobacillus bambusae TaxID=2024736 RepID=A0A2V1N2K4_9LACO|nr:hypothetical protein DCM90_06100 [Levilactobacillus bambusae]
MEAALQSRTKVVFLDGIYAYGDANGLVDENSPLVPNSRKGKAKKALSELIFSPQYEDIDKTLLRLPDYYGPSMRSATYLGMTLDGIANRQLTFYVGPKNRVREYVYLPDAAKMVVNIALASRAYNQVWNIPGQTITGNDLIKIAKQISGDTKPVLTLTKPLIRIVGLRDANVGEIAEMYYLTRRPLYLSHHKYEAQFGPVPATPWQIGLTATIKSMQK